MLLDEPKHKGSAPSPVLRAYQGRFALSGWKKTYLFPLFFVFFLFSVPAWATTCTYGDSLATNGGLGRYTSCTFATSGFSTNQIINTHYSSLVAANPSTVVVSAGSNDGASSQVVSHLNQISSQTGAQVVYIMPPNASDSFKQAVINGASSGNYQIYTPSSSDIAPDGVHLTQQGYKNTMNAVNSGQANNTSGSQVNSGNNCPTSNNGTSTSTPANSVGSVFTSSQSLTGQDDGNNQNCQNTCPGCCTCHIPIIQNHRAIRSHFSAEFQKHREWMVFTWWIEKMVPALKLMTSQMTATAMSQVTMIGSLLDAKHQLETQRLFQEMTALAHKDYHPSEGLCVFGTNIKNLAGSERLTAATHVGLAQRLQQRQLMTGDNLAQLGKKSDKDSRLKHYRKTYCNKQDNGKGLEKFCIGKPKTERLNKDVDFTNTVENALTLDLDMTSTGTAKTDDEEDIMALGANLFGHEIIPYNHPSIYAGPNGEKRHDALPWLMKMRSIIARRAVAQDSFAALAAMRTKGTPETIPFLRAILKELGLDQTEMDKFIGEDPSYFAQMEVLTKGIFKNPNFYIDLYDKPVNVERKAAVLDALGLMQDRDIYKSLLRSEASLAVLLENQLHKEQQRVSAQIQRAGAK